MTDVKVKQESTDVADIENRLAWRFITLLWLGWLISQLAKIDS